MVALLVAQYVVRYVKWWSKYTDDHFDNVEDAYNRYKELKQGGYEVVHVRKEYVMDLTNQMNERLQEEGE